MRTGMGSIEWRGGEEGFKFTFKLKSKCKDTLARG